MEILIPLPINGSANTYSELNALLKQLELAIHHAQKSVESAEENGVELTEDCFIDFRHPSLEQVEQNNLYDELQYVELHINLG